MCVTPRLVLWRLPCRVSVGGGVTLLVGLELLEAVRALKWPAPDADAAVNALLVPPPGADPTRVPSEEECLAAVRGHAREFVVIDALGPPDAWVARALPARWW